MIYVIVIPTHSTGIGDCILPSHHLNLDLKDASFINCQTCGVIHGNEVFYILNG